MDNDGRRRSTPSALKAFAIWFAAGAATGIAAGLLLTPSSEKNNSRAVGEKITTAASTIKMTLESVRVSAETLTIALNGQAQRFAEAFAVGLEEGRRIKEEMAAIARLDR